MIGLLIFGGGGGRGWGMGVWGEGEVWKNLPGTIWPASGPVASIAAIVNADCGAVGALP